MGISKTIPWRRFATPDAEFTYASSGTQASPDEARFFISAKKAGQQQIVIDWGDGTIERVAFGDVKHNYTASGDFAIRFFEADDKIATISAKQSDKVKGDVANLPTGANKYEFGFTSLSGNVNNIPQGASVYNFSFTSVTGEIKNLPAGASIYAFIFTGVTGQIADLPGGASIYNFRGTAISGDIKDLPPGATEYRFPATQISGDIENLPAGASVYQFKRNSAISGDIQNLPAGASVYGLNSTNVSGDIQDLPSGASTYALKFTNVTGKIENLPTGASTYNLLGTSVTGDIGSFRSLSGNLGKYILEDSSVADYTSGNYSVNVTGASIEIQNLGLSSSEVDNFLIDLEASGASSGTLNIAESNAARTSSSDAAVSALQNRGWSITVNT